LRNRAAGTGACNDLDANYGGALVRIERRFVWKDGRPDDHDALRSARIEHHVRLNGTRFELRGWDIRYTPGRPRVTEATYDEVSG